MKRAIQYSVVAASLALMAGHAWSVPVVYSSPLSPEAFGATGTGSVKVTIDDDTDMMRVEASFAGLSGTTTVAHIHCCTAAPGAGTIGVATYPGTFPSFPVGVSAGSYDMTFDMSMTSSFTAGFVSANGGTAATAFSALIAGFDSGRAYFNVHSSTFGGGEIRGFLALDRSTVPEPASLALVLAGLAAAGAAARRSRAG